jgi:hypothetical protein
VEILRLELTRFFASAGNDKAWRHRVTERLSKLNRLGGRHGVSFRADWTDRTLLVRHSSRRGLEEFRLHLSRGSGAVQRTLALALEAQASPEPDRGEALKELVRLQLREFTAAGARPLPFASGDDGDALFVDSPYRLHLSPGTLGPPRSSAAGFLLDSLRSTKPFHGWVLSEPGGGKTTLLDHVFRECCRLYLAGDLPFLPVHFPAAHVEIRQGRLWGWSAAAEAYLRENPEAAASLRDLELAGKLVIFVDALDENSDIADVSSLEVLRAWQSSLRGRCVLSCRYRFYAQQLEGGAFERLSPDRALMTLTEWGHTEARALFRRLASRPSAQLKSAFVHLADLSARDLTARTAAFRKTPLNLRLYSLFVAANRALFPRNEYELLEFVFQSLCRWQTAKRGRALPPEAVAGILTRLAWEGYAAGRGRARRFVSPAELARLLEERWPPAASKKERALAELESNPLLERDPESGVLSIDPHFMDFLAARQLIQTLRLQDVAQAAEQFAKPVLWDVARSLDEGTELLSGAERRDTAECLIGAFKAREREFERKRDFASALALNQLGYHLGKMGEAAGREFLHGVLKKRSPALKAEMCYWAIVIGLALSGDTAPLGDYIDRLEKHPRRPPPNMAYCQIYYLDKRVFDGDLMTALKEIGPTWEKTCDRLLVQLSSKTFSGIRLLDIFLLRRYLEVLGPAPFQAGGERERQESLRRLLPRLAAECAGDPRARLQLARLEKSLASFGLR